MKFNKQEAFDRSTSGIIAQGGPALGHGTSCAYLAPNGRKCAAGQLIPPDKYDALAMEGKAVSAPEVRAVFGMASDDSDLNFLRALQRAHDNAAAIPVKVDHPIATKTRPATDKEFWPRWRANLIEVAAIFALSSFATYDIPGVSE